MRSEGDQIPIDRSPPPFLGVFSNCNEHNDLARNSSQIRHRNTQIAGTTYIDYAYDREHCVAFCVDVEHATELAKAFNAQNLTSAVIHGALPKEQRKQLLKDSTMARSEFSLTVRSSPKAGTSLRLIASSTPRRPNPAFSIRRRLAAALDYLRKLGRSTASST